MIEKLKDGTEVEILGSSINIPPGKAGQQHSKSGYWYRVGETEWIRIPFRKLHDFIAFIKDCESTCELFKTRYWMEYK